jgi:hypothetical protein
LLFDDDASPGQIAEKAAFLTNTFLETRKVAKLLGTGMFRG